MATVRVGDVFNHLVFGTVDSRDYNIYITGEAVYGAPVRAIESVSVPGRNGDILLDHGHWENIAVTYRCGIATDKPDEFSSAMSAFRNAIASQIGYKRLSDTYNPDEFRLAAISGGFETSTVQSNRAGEFGITFNAKPQRFLLSGDVPQSVADGGVLTNPTEYGSEPLLMVRGTGTITLNGEETISIDGSNPIGTIEISPSKNYYGNSRFGDNYIPYMREATDPIYCGHISIRFALSFLWLATVQTIGSPVVTDSFGGLTTASVDRISCNVAIDSYRYTTPRTDTITVRCPFDVELAGTPERITLTINISISAEDRALKFNVTEASFRESDGSTSQIGSVQINNASVPIIYCDSSAPIGSGDPLYIDMEIGEAYIIEAGEIISYNYGVSLGNDLWKLKSGENVFDLSGEWLRLEVVPRWWKL